MLGVFSDETDNSSIQYAIKTPADGIKGFIMYLLCIYISQDNRIISQSYATERKKRSKLNK